MASIIVAESLNGVIGNSNDLPWYLPADLRHFKEITTGKIVVMGRKTFGSIFNRLKGPLPNRRNIIVSTTMTDNIPEGFEVYSSLEELGNNADLSSSDLFFIGGGKLYESVLKSDLVDRIFLTLVHTNLNGDAYFPKLDPSKWTKTDEEKHNKDEKNIYDYDFIIYDKAP